ncbi:hypothetical protein Aph02nite_17080 [Actinoplanes philippinensis]|uniref:Uncharacterized protein n=1 Tax=Actinoplanes philippinensis TaxID=35752 RepID=A0A1I2B8D8_9ACTN|nr:hypothetical protein [Actinoplanes philippinensis]GIE75758.1 hypothetical protein Aph02nite_17080 [Actinoplanes philippinensis]SFE52472.1 hypothetical protein SAMN05421541_102172 [Actinoplanes philippinensis]
MTSTTTQPRWVIDLEDTVRFTTPDFPELTTRDLSAYRSRPPAFRRPEATGEIPVVAPDPEQERFNRFFAGALDRELPAGRHRSSGQPGLLVRLARTLLRLAGVR